MDSAFAYSGANPLQTEDSYPYVASRQGCRYNRGAGVVGAVNYVRLPPNDPNQIAAALNNGPVSVVLEADKPVF